MIPKIPAAATCDPGHAELVILGLIVLLIIMAKLWWKERQSSLSEETKWKERLEAKLDIALLAHDACQKSLPFLYVTKEDFKVLYDDLKQMSNDRNIKWNTFTEKFDALMEKFGKHRHDQNGKVDV